MIDRLDILALAPHPDDLEILCGGTLAKLVDQGYSVGILDLTTGEPTPRGTPEKRREEAEAARKILGVGVRVLVDLPNRVLMDAPEHRFKVAEQIRKYRPQIIIASYGRTPVASPDHHQSGLLVEASRFYSQLTKWDDRFGGTAPYRVPHLVYAPFPFEPEPKQFRGGFVIDITDTIDRKIAAIRAYESQFDSGRFEMVEHMIRSQAGWVRRGQWLQVRRIFWLATTSIIPKPFCRRDRIRREEWQRSGAGSRSSADGVSQLWLPDQPGFDYHDLFARRTFFTESHAEYTSCRCHRSRPWRFSVEPFARPRGHEGHRSRADASRWRTMFGN